jgi:hypothetical protein
MFKISLTNKCYNEWLELMNKFWMSYSSINSKKMHDYKMISKNGILSFGVPKPY